MSEVLVITSGKGGVGKTTTTSNIGAGLAMLGYKTVLIDADLGLRNLDLVLGMENRIVFTITDVFEGECKLSQALIRNKNVNNLYLLPASQVRDKSAVSRENMYLLIQELKKDFDYIIIDCPAGIEEGFRNSIVGVDRALVVTTPEVSAIRDADRIIGLLEANEIHKIDLIVNRVRHQMVKTGEMMSAEDVTEMLAINLIGIIPDDIEIIKSANEGSPIVMQEQSTILKTSYMDICKRVLGEEIEFKKEEPKSTFKQLVKKYLGKE